jgi:nitroreductase
MSSDPDPCAPTAVAADPPVTGRQLATLMHARRTVLPMRLVPPGPEGNELELILGAASAAPDHGALVPWRFVIVPLPHRQRLAEVFAESLLQRDGAATPEQRGRAREEAFRAPVLMLALAQLGQGNDNIPSSERLISAGCAIQNMLLMATALGFGSALTTTGKALQSDGLRALFSLAEHDEPLCFISFGTAMASMAGSARPGLDRYVSELGRTP